MLETRGILDRKGFPESYDQRALLAFVADVKSGAPSVQAPVYSHLEYDVGGRHVTIERPDILIVEGLNVLQTGVARAGTPQVFVSDFFDLSIYVDADEKHVRDLVPQPLPHPARDRLPRRPLLLPPLRRPHRRGGRRDRGRHLGPDQRAQPAHERPPRPGHART